MRYDPGHHETLSWAVIVDGVASSLFMQRRASLPSYPPAADDEIILSARHETSETPVHTARRRASASYVSPALAPSLALFAALLMPSIAGAAENAVLEGTARRPRCTRAVALGNETALRVHNRSRDDLREFYWAYTARLQERAPAGAVLGPAHDRHAQLPWLAHADALKQAELAGDAPIAEVARARVVDLLNPDLLRALDRQLKRVSGEQLTLLLRANAPTLRAHVWLWLATTRAGGCALSSLELDFVEDSLAERSLVVEHGEEVLLRPVADYVLAARARMVAGPPGSLDQLLERLAITPSDATSNRIHPLTRATAHAMLIRRGQLASVEPGLAHPYPAVRAAVALALMDAAPGSEHESLGAPAAIVELAANDPNDRVTETLVGRLLADAPAIDGVPQPQGALAESDDPRILETVARWQGRGDPLAPLPKPRPRTPTTVEVEAPEDSGKSEKSAEPSSSAEPGSEGAPATEVVDDEPLPGIFDNSSAL